MVDTFDSEPVVPLPLEEIQRTAGPLLGRPERDLANGGIVRRPPYVCIEPDEEFRTLDPANRQRSIDLMREVAERHYWPDGSRLWLPGDPAPLPISYADEPQRPEYPPLPPPAVRLAWAATVIAAAFLLTLVVGLILRAAS